MTPDARFEDGPSRPLNLGAHDLEDLNIISALAQDAILPLSQISWNKSRHRLALLINRLRREETPDHPERVQSLLVINTALTLSAQGSINNGKESILSLLAITFTPDNEPPGGILTLTFAQNTALRARVEAIDITLRDVTRPYLAPSGKIPDHGT